MIHNANIVLDINKYYELNVWVNGDPQTCSALCLGSQTSKIQNKNTFVGLMQIVQALAWFVWTRVCLRTSITEIRAFFFLDSRWLYGLSPSRICATCRRAWETGRRIPRCLKVKATAHSHVKWDTPCRQIICRLVQAVGCASELPCFRTGGFHGPPCLAPVRVFQDFNPMAYG